MASAKGAKSKKRTSTQAIQTDQQQIGGIQQEQGRTTKKFHKEIGSYKGATNMSIAQIQAQNLGGLRGTPEGKQLAQEYKSRIGDLRRSLPFTIAPVQRDYKSSMQGLSSDLASAQLGLQQDQADRAAAIQEIQATRKQNQLEATQEIQKNKSEKRAGVDTAYKEALRIIRRQQLDNANPDVKDEDKGPPVPQTEAEWMDFQDHLEGTSEIDHRAAVKAVKALKARIATTREPSSRGPEETKFDKRFRLPSTYYG